MRLAIGIPVSWDFVSKKLFFSFVTMDKCGLNYVLLDADADSVCEMRNLLVTGALKENADALLMLDADQEYPEHTIPALLSHLAEGRADVASALCYRGYPPFEPLVYRGEEEWVFATDEEFGLGEVLEVTTIPGGCFLADIEVFKRIKEPWFRKPRSPLTGRRVGEDLYFGMRCRRAGFRMCVDTRVRVGHTKPWTIQHRSYLIWKELRRRGLLGKVDEMTAQLGL